MYQRDSEIAANPDRKPKEGIGKEGEQNLEDSTTDIDLWLASRDIGCSCYGFNEPLIEQLYYWQKGYSVCEKES